MDKLTLFENPEFGSVRTIEINNEPWFVMKDVCAALGLTTKHISDRLDEDEVSERRHRMPEPVVTIIRPQLTPEERERRMHVLSDRIAAFWRACERRNYEKRKEEAEA